MLSVIWARPNWPGCDAADCLASAPIASVATTGSIFFSTSGPMPVADDGVGGDGAADVARAQNVARGWHCQSLTSCPADPSRPVIVEVAAVLAGRSAPTSAAPRPPWLRYIPLQPARERRQQRAERRRGLDPATTRTAARARPPPGRPARQGWHSEYSFDDLPCDAPGRVSRWPSSTSVPLLDRAHHVLDFCCVYVASPRHVVRRVTGTDSYGSGFRVQGSEFSARNSGSAY